MTLKVNFMTDVLFDAEFFRRKFVYARSGNAARDNVSLSFSKLQLEIRSRLVPVIVSQYNPTHPRFKVFLLQDSRHDV